MLQDVHAALARNAHLHNRHLKVDITISASIHLKAVKHDPERIKAVNGAILCAAAH